MGWEAVARDRYLYRREGRFYVRRRVPKELVDVLGREHIVESLRTSDHREANRRAILKVAEIQKRFDAALGEPASPENRAVRSLDDLTIRQIEEIAFQWFRRETQRIDDAYAAPDVEFRIQEADEAEERDPRLEARDLRQEMARLQRGTEDAVEAELRPVIAQICQSAGLDCRVPICRGIASKSPEIVADRRGSKYRILGALFVGASWNYSDTGLPSCQRNHMRLRMTNLLLPCARPTAEPGEQ